MSTGFITDIFSHSVEASGEELSVSLLVDGVWIQGWLTPETHYLECTKSMFIVAHELGGGAMDGTTEPPSASTSAAAQERWSRNVKASGPDGAPTVDVIHVRDARAFSHTSGQVRRFPFLRIAAAHVAAITMGTVVEHPEAV